ALRTSLTPHSAFRIPHSALRTSLVSVLLCCLLDAFDRRARRLVPVTRNLVRPLVCRQSLIVLLVLFVHVTQFELRGSARRRKLHRLFQSCFRRFPFL